MRQRALAALGEALSRRLRPRVVVAGRSRPAYGLCVCGGSTLGAVGIVALGAWRGVSPPLALASAAAGIAAALTLAFATKAATGGERFTFYHYQLVVLAAAGGLLAAAGRPFLVYLDLVAIGLAVAQAIGRLGCLAAGCCHGRPVSWGVRYGERHADDGFPRELVGVPLAPVPAAESLAAATLALGGGALVIAGRGAGGPAPGTTLAVYLAGYAAVRFLLERWRGDRRPARAGLSEAQWTALATLAAVVALGLAGRLPLGRPGVAAGAALLAVLAAVALVDRHRHAGGLLAGAHATEIAAQLAGLLRREARPPAAPGDPPPVGTTTRRLRLSTAILPGPETPLRLVSFSVADAPLPARTASGLARLVRRQLGTGGGSELRRGGHGVWHLLVPAGEAETS